MSKNVTDEDIRYCYRIFLEREPDAAGLQLYKDLVEHKGFQLGEIRDSFLYSYEFQKLQEKQNTPVLVELKDFNIYVRLNDHDIGAVIARTKVYEPYIVGEFKRQINGARVFLDVGANIGFYSLLAASVCKSYGKVVAFEPNQANVKLLRMSIDSNQFDSIDVYDVALSDQNDTVGLMVAGVNSNGQIVENKDEDGYEFMEKVSTVTLDDFMPELDQVDVIKLDIEGAEPRAIKGMERLIQRCKPVIFMEFSPELLKSVSKETGEETLNNLERHGYKFYVLDRAKGRFEKPSTIVDITNDENISKFGHVDLMCSVD